MKHPDINYIILVPEQFTMQTQKELVLRHPRHGIMNIDVLSFARLAFRVLEETGNGSREILDDEGKNLILRRLAGKKEDSLKVLKGNIKKPGYISEVKSVISELTQYNISPDGMDDMITEADESSYLAWKLKDIQVMYQAFEEYLADKYITKEEILDILCNVMDKSRMLKDSVIALDGFTGFTPLQNKVLGEMLHHCQKVMITVTMDKREDPYVMKDKYQLFALSKQMVTSLVKIAGEEKVLVEEPVCLYQEPVWRFRNAPALAFLEKELFRYSGRTYREKQSNVRVYAAANPRMEVECAAQRIRFLIRKKEYRYREIAVIASDMNLYADEIENITRNFRQLLAEMKQDGPERVRQTAALTKQKLSEITKVLPRQKSGLQLRPEGIMGMLSAALNQITVPEEYQAELGEATDQLKQAIWNYMNTTYNIQMEMNAHHERNPLPDDSERKS